MNLVYDFGVPRYLLLEGVFPILSYVVERDVTGRVFLGEPWRAILDQS